MPEDTRPPMQSRCAKCGVTYEDHTTDDFDTVLNGHRFAEEGISYGKPSQGYICKTCGKQMYGGEDVNKHYEKYPNHDVVTNEKQGFTESTMQDNPMQDENETKNIQDYLPQISYESRVDCPACDGKGYVGGDECNVCHGSTKMDIGESLPSTNMNFYQWWESLKSDERQEIANSVGVLDSVENKDWTQLHIIDQEAIHAKYIRDGGESDDRIFKCPTCGYEGNKPDVDKHRYKEHGVIPSNYSANRLEHNQTSRKYEESHEDLDLDKWLEEEEKQDKYIRDGGNEVEWKEIEPLQDNYMLYDPEIDSFDTVGNVKHMLDVSELTGRNAKENDLDLDKWLEEQEKQDKLDKAWDLRDADKFLNEENFGKPYNNEDIPGEILINQNIQTDTPFNEVDANNMEDGKNTSDFVNGGDADYKDIKGEATPTDSERWDAFTYGQKWDSIKPLQVTFSLSEDEIQNMANGSWDDLPPAMKHELSLTGYNPDNEELYSQEAGPADITMDLDNGKGKVDKTRDIDTSQQDNLELQNTIEQISGGDEQMDKIVGEGTLEKVLGNGSKLEYCKFCNSTEDYRSGACARCNKPFNK
jgi:hypothetical protein